MHVHSHQENWEYLGAGWLRSGTGVVKGAQLTSSMEASPQPQHPKPPKKPLTPYMKYSKEIWQTVKATSPNMSACEIGATIGKMWRELGDMQKQKFKEEFMRDKALYDEALQEYLKVTGLNASDLNKPKQKKKSEPPKRENHTPTGGMMSMPNKAMSGMGMPSMPPYPGQPMMMPQFSPNMNMNMNMNMSNMSNMGNSTGAAAAAAAGGIPGFGHMWSSPYDPQGPQMNPLVMASSGQQMYRFMNGPQNMGSMGTMGSMGSMPMFYPHHQMQAQQQVQPPPAHSGHHDNHQLYNSQQLHHHPGSTQGHPPGGTPTPPVASTSPMPAHTQHGQHGQQSQGHHPEHQPPSYDGHSLNNTNNTWP